MSAIFPLLGVVIGGLLAFLTQYLLHRQQERTEIRKKAIDVKNQQCLALWKTLSDTYQYLFFSGGYSADKVDVEGLGRHIRMLNVAIIRAEPFLSRRSFLRLMEVRNAVNEFFGELESAKLASYEEYVAFIAKLEGPMGRARDVLREELQLAELGLLRPAKVA
ncbi:MAG: hypothetical protein GXP39_07160 [Chloroflexi bacterium]|nr:hypothetical protein [Chloroflexota bacterium]